MAAATGLRRALGPAVEGLAATLEAGSREKPEGRVVALRRFARVLQRAGEGAAPLLIAMDADLDVLRWLVHHDDQAVRSAAIAAAGHLGLTSWLARDPAPVVRSAVARTSPASPTVLRGLAGDEDRGVREALASRHATLPEDVSSQLAVDPSWQVRFALAGRPGLPGPVVRLLTEDADRRVRARIGARPVTLPSTEPEPRGAERMAARAPDGATQ